MKQDQKQKDENNSIDKNELYMQLKQYKQDNDKLTDEYDNALRNIERLKGEALERNKITEKDEVIENMSKEKQMLESKLNRFEKNNKELSNELDEVIEKYNEMVIEMNQKQNELYKLRMK